MEKLFVVAKGCVPKANCKNFLEELPTTSIPVGQNVQLGEVNNISPQEINVRLRPNMKHKVEFSAKKDQNPVDIYFLLDVTGSMKPYKEELTKVPDELVKTIQEKTDNYRFGYGTFTEKAMTPMGHINKTNKYDFLHLQDMTSDTNQLIQKIRLSGETTTSNLDIPEAGWDALMQVPRTY